MHRFLTILSTVFCAFLLVSGEGSAQDLQKTNPASSDENHDAVIVPVTSEKDYAVIVFTKGDVVFRSAIGGEKRHAERQDKIHFDGMIETGENGFASLTFSPQIMMNVQPESRISLIKRDCADGNTVCTISVVTNYGSANVYDDAGRSDPTRFTIESPYNSAFVRGGPRFHVELPVRASIGLTDPKEIDLSVLIDLLNTE